MVEQEEKVDEYAEVEAKYELSDLMKAMMDKTQGKNPEFYEKYDKIGDTPLGTGLFSNVWKVKRKGDESGQEFAAKEFNDFFNTGYGPEIGPLKLLNHPNIVKLVDDMPNEETGGVMVLDLIPGRVLKDYLYETRGTLIPKKQLFEWFVQMATATTYLSEEVYVLHCDLHAENWRIRSTDNQMVLLDFTTGRVLGKDGQMSKDIPFGLTGRIWNPIAYAPEQGAHEDYGFPAEVWWLAAIFTVMSSPNRKYAWEYEGTKYESMQDEPMTNGHLYTEIMTEKMAHTPPPAEYGEEYVNLIAKMLSFDPEQRPKMSEVLASLKEILASCE